MDLRYWIGFNLVKGIGPARVRRLLDYFGDLALAWQASPEALGQAGLDRLGTGAESYGSARRDRPGPGPEAHRTGRPDGAHLGVAGLSGQPSEHRPAAARALCQGHADPGRRMGGGYGRDAPGERVRPRSGP